MWDKKYRPQKFSDVLGQPGNVQLLKARLRHGTAFDTSYIFRGGHGQGKTTLARIHARAMLCQNLNKEDPEPCNECENCRLILNDEPGPFAERDAASQGKVEDMRAIVETIGFALDNAPMRIELFDEAHRMGPGAQDVLLKPLEEKKMVGMFCTTEPEKIKGTIRSRCEEYVIRKVTREEVLERCRFVAQTEGVAAEDDALLTIIDSSGGHIRDILNKMEMIAQIGDINLANTREYLHLGAITIYYDILLSLGDASKAVALVDQACELASAEEVLSGIAEAAMNSYRLQNNMFAEFAYVDRALGKKVYETYRDNTIRYAAYFLRNRFATRVGLMKDVLLLSQLPGNLPPDEDVPLFVMGVPQQTVSVALPPAPAPVAAGAAGTLAPPPEAAKREEAPSSNNGGTPPDPPLHDLDAKVNGSDLPRMRTNAVQKPVIGDKYSEDLDLLELPPDVWRKEFLKKWPGARGSDG